MHTKSSFRTSDKCLHVCDHQANHQRVKTEISIFSDFEKDFPLVEFMRNGRRLRLRRERPRTGPCQCAAPETRLFCSPSACGSPIKGPTPCQHPATKTATAGILLYFLPVFSMCIFYIRSFTQLQFQAYCRISISLYCISFCKYDF